MLFGEPITSFTGDYRFLSNFWLCPVEWQGIVFPSAEHAFVFGKTDRFPKSLRRVLETRLPGAVKRLGRSVPLRPDWDRIKDGVMYEVVLSKFSLNEDLKAKLLATGAVPLVEGNTWGDKYWGQDPIGTGENRLGKVLMRVRNELT